MEELDRIIYEVKDLAKDAGDATKTIAGDVMDRAKKLTEEGGKAREAVKEKVQDVLQDSKAVKEIHQGISELEALPEMEGSILYMMEYETTINYLNSLQLAISDKRMDSRSAVEEIREVMEKVQPSSDPQETQTDEQQAIENVKAIAYSACTRALEALDQAE